MRSAIVVVNYLGKTLPLTAGDIGMLDALKSVRNVWTLKNIPDFKEVITQRIQPHETVLLRMK